MIVHVRNHWSVAGSFHPSHRPANTNGASSFMPIAYGIFPPDELLPLVVAPGRVTIKAGGSSYASITIVHGMFCEHCMLSRKNPALFENLKILAFYAILPRTPIIACESFMEALLSGFQRVVCRLVLPFNRWLKRPTPNASRRCPPFIPFR